MSSPPVENVFARSWSLLKSNWIIIVPGLVIGVIAGIVGALLAPAPTVAEIGGGTLYSASTARTPGIIGLIAIVLNVSYTTGMAGAAWQRGVATLADGAAAVREDFVRVLIAMVLLGFVAVVLGVLTFGLGALIFGFFAIYTMASVVLANNGAITALKESFSIVSSRWVPTLLVVCMLVIVGFVAAIVQGLLLFVPLLGPIVAAAINGAFAAFATLVIVGEYLAFRRDLRPNVV